MHSFQILCIVALCSTCTRALLASCASPLINTHMHARLLAGAASGEVVCHRCVCALVRARVWHGAFLTMFASLDRGVGHTGGVAAPPARSLSFSCSLFLSLSLARSLSLSLSLSFSLSLSLHVCVCVSRAKERTARARRGLRRAHEHTLQMAQQQEPLKRCD